MKDNFFHKIANILPRRIVKWCVIRVFAEVTSGTYSNTVASELTVFEALKRFDNA